MKALFIIAAFFVSGCDDPAPETRDVPASPSGSPLPQPQDPEPAEPGATPTPGTDPAPDDTDPQVPPAAGGAPNLTHPGLRIVFPPPGATAEASITVRVEAPEAASVMVGAISAAQLGEGAFSAEVPLALGLNTIAVTAVWEDGPESTSVAVQRFSDAAAISRGENALWSSYQLQRMVASPAGDQLYIVCGAFDGVVSVDLASGDHRFATCSEATPACAGGGVGADMTAPIGIALRETPSEALVADGGQIIAVDLSSGDRSVRSGMGLGDGPLPSKVLDLVYDPARDKALLAAVGPGALMEVDLATGTRELLADLTNPIGFALDTRRERLLWIGAYSGSIGTFQMAAKTHGSLTGSTLDFDELGAIVYDERADLLYAWDKATSRLFRVDLATETASEVLAGLQQVNALAATAGFLFVRSEDGLLAVEPYSGDAVVISR